MPDHVHFFSATGGERESASLSSFVGGVKAWTARAVFADDGQASPLWQRGFFDRLLRSGESYERAWAYVRDNPVRAGFVVEARDWPFAGELEPLERL